MKNPKKAKKTVNSEKIIKKSLKGKMYITKKNENEEKKGKKTEGGFAVEKAGSCQNMQLRIVCSNKQ